MDCDNQETEATKTIGSTDIEKVLKKLKNKNTKESIILLDYIEKLEKEKEIKLLREAVKKLQADIEIKDKVIDLMADKLSERSEWYTKERWKEICYKQVEKVEEENE